MCEKPIQFSGVSVRNRIRVRVSVMVRVSVKVIGLVLVLTVGAGPVRLKPSGRRRLRSTPRSAIYPLDRRSTPSHFPTI